MAAIFPRQPSRVNRDSPDRPIISDRFVSQSITSRERLPTDHDSHILHDNSSDDEYTGRSARAVRTDRNRTGRRHSEHESASLQRIRPFREVFASPLPVYLTRLQKTVTT